MSSLPDHKYPKSWDVVCSVHQSLKTALGTIIDIQQVCVQIEISIVKLD